MSSYLPKVLAICGSIKQDSANYTLLKTIRSMAKDLFELEIYESLAALPYFNPDETDHAPESVVDFRNRIDKADGVIVCTPEYVFSLPGILKNALEWTVSTVVFTDKPAALITASSSGKVAHESLQLVMKTIGVKTTEDTSLLIQSIKSKMTQEGVITNEETLVQVDRLIKGLNKLILER
jgi:chromate reductase